MLALAERPPSLAGAPEGLMDKSEECLVLKSFDEALQLASGVLRLHPPATPPFSGERREDDALVTRAIAVAMQCLFELKRCKEVIELVRSRFQRAEHTPAAVMELYCTILVRSEELEACYLVLDEYFPTVYPSDATCDSPDPPSLPAIPRRSYETLAQIFVCCVLIPLRKLQKARLFISVDEHLTRDQKMALLAEVEKVPVVIPIVQDMRIRTVPASTPSFSSAIEEAYKTVQFHTSGIITLSTLIRNALILFSFLCLIFNKRLRHRLRQLLLWLWRRLVEAAGMAFSLSLY
eukprot:gnl/Hemi2/18309_TR6056_c0_g1_i1.p1 gnl/Hemi2/18309_TR6056_c0_g1~~gnl/Hemi2/18309_TR6056_c0_g1_i1.p1  ORF type:complete len:310 (-),score=37.62 gnl/Hemi2/18309_TR6056_c0_g1_i1:64-939(-)